MKLFRWALPGLLLLFAFALFAQPQVGPEPEARPAVAKPVSGDFQRAAAVPRLIRFTGVLKDTAGKPRTGQVAVQFAIYRGERDELALWMETQNVEADERGQYTVLLGAASPEGILVELFAAAEQRYPPRRK